MLYDMTDGSLRKVQGTTFKEEKVLERTHLQAGVRDHIEVLGPDLLVVAEEFGDFEDTHRRIDLLCIDRTARLVVVELKRTEDGSHMELQALRYAAMVSVMTFDELITTYARFRQQTGKGDNDRDEARAELLDWIDEVEDDEPVVSREVGIILAAADFSQEITTTVLWLNEFHATDIRCVRLSPYRHEGRLLLDVQQVIPLPEARELMVRLRRREIQARAAKTSSARGADWTQYVVEYPGGQTEPLRKRRAILAMVHALADAGVDRELIAQAVPQEKFRSVLGRLEGEQLAAAFAAAHRPDAGEPAPLVPRRAGPRWGTDLGAVEAVGHANRGRAGGTREAGAGVRVPRCRCEWRGQVAVGPSETGAPVLMPHVLANGSATRLCLADSHHGGHG